MKAIQVLRAGVRSPGRARAWKAPRDHRLLRPSFTTARWIMDSLSFGHGAVGRLFVRLSILGLVLLLATPVPRALAAGDPNAKGDAISPVEDFSRELDKLKKSFGELGKKMDDSAKAIDEYTDAEKARKE